MCVAQRQSQPNVDDGSGNAFEVGNEQRIRVGHLTRQVVVQRPAQAGARDQRRAQLVTGHAGRCAGPGWRRATEHNQQHAQHHAPVGVSLNTIQASSAVSTPFQIEQQRGRGSAHVRQTEHQQGGARHPAAGNGAPKPGPFATPKPGCASPGRA